MTSRRRFLKTAGAAASIMGVAGCTGGGDGGDGGGGDGGDGGGGDGGDGGSTPTPTEAEGTKTGTPSEEGDIVIGAAMGLSGAIPPNAKNGLAGLKYGVQQINENGGVMGRNLRVVSSDTGSDPSKAITAFQRFVDEEGAVAVYGPILSNVGIAVRREAEKKQVPYIPQVAASGALLNQDTRYTFRLGSHPAPNYAQATAQIAEEQNIDTISAIYADYAWGQSFKKSLRRHAPKEKLVEATAPVGAGDFTQYLRQMPQDLGVMAGVAHPVGISTIYKQMYDLGKTAQVFPGGVEDPQRIYGAHGSLAERSYAVYTVYDWHSDAFQSFGEQFRSDNDSFPNTSDVIGYTAANLIAEAIRNAGSTDHTDVANAIRGISYDTFYNGTIEYTEWGEFKNMPFTFGKYTGGSEYGVDFDFEPWFEFEFEPFKPWEV